MTQIQKANKDFTMHNKKVNTFSKKFTKAVSTALVLAMLVGTTRICKNIYR